MSSPVPRRGTHRDTTARCLDTIPEQRNLEEETA
jgi:hypothetical protein